MGAVEKAVDAAAEFIGPFIEPSTKPDVKRADNSRPIELVQQALSHLQAINIADLDADPDAPYDASLAGVVYGLLDLIVSQGILPHLSPGVAFSQRPQSVLTAALSLQEKNEEQLSNVVETLMSILRQGNSGVQPLISQRNLPDIVSALAELSFSPSSPERHETFKPIYHNTIAATSTSRLLPIFTTFLQQPLPLWLKPVISRELSIIPLRKRGIRHAIEFMALAYLSKNSAIPQDANGAQSQLPIPLEAVTQASRLLVLPPQGMTQDEWLRKLAPQLWTLVDGMEGPELSRAAGQIIAEGILSKRTTGAPGSVGWELFAQPLLDKLNPKTVASTSFQRRSTEVLVQEQDLMVSLNRLSIIASSYSRAGTIRRLIRPLLLPLWGLLTYTQSRPTLNKNWSFLSKSSLSRYMIIACDPKQVDDIAQNIFWDGPEAWTYAPGSGGGIEIRRRVVETEQINDMGNIFARIGSLDTHVNLLVSLLADAKTSDDVVGSIFLQTTRRWLSPSKDVKRSLIDEVEVDPLALLTDAKLTEAMANTFKDQFARSPQHIMDLMSQLLSSFVSEHRRKVEDMIKKSKSVRASLQGIVAPKQTDTSTDGDNSDEDLVSFAISILSTLVSSPDFKQTPGTRIILASTIAPLVYLSQEQPQLPMHPLVVNSANALLQLLQPPTLAASLQPTDPLAEHRATLKAIHADINSREPPNRTWALKTLHKLIKEPGAFPVIDSPSTTHLLLSASLKDPESYVHIAAMPVLVELAIQAPNPTVKIIVDAFIDIDEQSLKLARGRQTEEKERELQEALDFRLRVGEVLNKLLLSDTFWESQGAVVVKHKIVNLVTSSCLSLASRRGQRTETRSARTAVAQAEQQIQAEGEAAWGGPIPNLLDPNSEDTQDQAERDELLGIVKGWEAAGIEEDVRIRASALSLLGTVLEQRLAFLKQVSIDAAMQMVLLILTMETTEAKAILRRAAELVIMGLLRGLDAALESGQQASIGLSMAQQAEIERVIRWLANEDGDALVKDHAASVLEGLETLRLKRMYKVRDEGMRLGADLDLGGTLRGLNVQPDLGAGKGAGGKMIVEEIE